MHGYYRAFAKVPSKLLTSIVTHNFDSGSKKIKKIVGASCLKKRHPLTKAFKSEIYFEMAQKIKDGFVASKDDN
jgi:hypothetical protein